MNYFAELVATEIWPAIVARAGARPCQWLWCVHARAPDLITEQQLWCVEGKTLQGPAGVIQMQPSQGKVDEPFLPALVQMLCSYGRRPQVQHVMRMLELPEDAALVEVL